MDTMNQIPLPPQKEGGAGPLISVILIILLLAAGGLYFYNVERSADIPAPAMQSAAATEDPQTEALKVTSTSDTAASIEADLDTTDLGDIDAELSDIEAQI